MPLGRPVDRVDEMLPIDLVGIRATAQAQRRTGVAISLEPPMRRSVGQVSRADLGLAILDLLIGEGVSPGRVVVTTLDGSVLDLIDTSGAIRRIADTGSFIQIGLWVLNRMPQRFRVTGKGHDWPSTYCTRDTASTCCLETMPPAR